MELTVVILAAGFGSRMGMFSAMINKSIIPYNNRALISHIIDKFPKDSKFIIACGHNAEQVKTYVSNVHSDKNIQFVDVPDYSSIDAGPATTLRHCAPYIQGGFFCITCDTLFDFDYSKHLDNNWIGTYPVNSDISADYCWVTKAGNDITSIHNKVGSSSPVDAFTGLMYFKDKEYLEVLEAKSAKELYEGFLDINLSAYELDSWQDFGTYDKWELLNNETKMLSLPKPNEIFYSDNNKIIKYTSDKNLAYLRYIRANINSECMPKNVTYDNNFLIYDRVEGETFYENLNLENFDLFLEWVLTSVWTRDVYKERVHFNGAYKFYKTKTDDRYNLFKAMNNNWSGFTVVNNCQVKDVDAYLSLIDYSWLSSETKWAFIHGDMQFENIIFNKETYTFTAIDWRPDFGGDYYGDIYYDLAKLLGGLYLDYKSLRDNSVECSEFNNQASIILTPVKDLDLYVTRLRNFVENLGLDWKKVETLVPIIYINMSPLHAAPLDKYLIALGQYYFSKL